MEADVPRLHDAGGGRFDNAGAGRRLGTCLTGVPFINLGAPGRILASLEFVHEKIVGVCIGRRVGSAGGGV